MADPPGRIRQPAAPVDEALKVEAARAVRRASVSSSGSDRRVVRGIEISSTQIGPGRGPTRMMALEDEHMSITSADVGFPMANSTTTSDAVAGFVAFRAGAPSMRWSGFDVRDGLILEYGAASDHAGTNIEGSSYTFAIIDLEALQERAETVGTRFAPTLRGSIRDVSAKASASEVARQLLGLSSLRDGVVPPPPLMDDLLTAFTKALGLGSEQRTARTLHRVDRASVVRRCIEFAASIDHRPSINELCRAAGVSERTLREAFIWVYDLPPSVFFRLSQLDRAHDRLSSGEVITGGVAEVALAAGFGNLGRFAHYYRQLFGRLPSETYRLSVASEQKRGLGRFK